MANGNRTLKTHRVLSEQKRGNLKVLAERRANSGYTRLSFKRHTSNPCELILSRHEIIRLRDLLTELLPESDD